MIDWSLAKLGAIAVHRNNGRSVIREYLPEGGTRHYPKRIAIQNYHLSDQHWTYDENGEQGEGTGDDSGCPFDIIAIEAAPEPKRETVTLNGHYTDIWTFGVYKKEFCSHRITFDMLDGEPDCDSVRMEKL